MKTLKVGIASYAEMKARTLAIAKGDLKPKAGDPKVWFTSPESFAKLLSNRNRSLLGVIAETRPESLNALATVTGRTPGNLSHPADDGTLRPCPPPQGGARRGQAGKCPIGMSSSQ